MKNNKGFAPIIVVLIIIAVLVVGGIAYYVGKSSSPAFPTTQDNNNYSPADQNGVKSATPQNPLATNLTTSPINITFPTAGVTLVEGKTYNITWTNSSNNNITYGLSLNNDQAGIIRIGGETSQNSYSWTVPSVLNYMNGGDSYHDVAPVDGYRISVVNLQDKKTYYSPVFKIVPSASTQNININGITIKIPISWKLQVPTFSNDCERSEACSSEAAGKGTSSYKIYNPSVTTGVKTNDFNAIYVTVGDCANSALPCPVLSDPQYYPNLKSIYTHGLTIQTYGNNAEAVNVYNSIKDQLK